VLAWGLGGATLAAVAEPAVGISLTNLVEQIPLEQLGEIPIQSVSTASRYTQKATEAPSSVTVITSDEIKQFGYRTLADILAGVNGLYVTYDRSYTYLGVRGFNRPGDYNSRVLVMVDGHRVNDNVFGGGYIGREFILDVDLIERVEVVRGPSSSLYGSSAFFAVVNVITKRAAAVQPVEVAGEAGSFGALKGRVTAAGVCPKTGAEVLVSGTRYTSRGPGRLYYPEFDTPEQNSGSADRRDGEVANNFYGSLRYRDLTVSAAHVYRDKEIPTASWGTLFNDPRYHATDAHGYVDFKLQHKLDAQREFMLRGYFDEIRYGADYPFGADADGNGAVLNRDNSVGRMVGGEAQWLQRWHTHTFTLGGELRRHVNQDLQNFDLEPYVLDADLRQSSYDGGLYAQDEIMLRSNLLVNVGLRYDYYESFGGTLNPRLGVIWGPWEHGTLKLLYGRAFRAPNVYELYYPLGENPPNAGLAPERIQTYEAVFEQYLGKSLRVSLAGYYYRCEDLISLDPETLVFQNVDEVRTRGVEAEAEWRHASGVRLRAGCSLQRAEDAKTGERLSNSPEQLAKFHVLVPLLSERVFAGLELLYTGRADTLPERATAFADAFWVANLTLFSQKLIEGLELSISLYNLFNTDYANPGGPGLTQDLVQQDGRTLRVKATYRF
jgi:iron complex outermembrane receptor protein